MTDVAPMFQPLKEEELAVTEARGAAPEPDTWRPLMPVPDDAPRVYPPHRLGKPDREWQYRDAKGQLLGSTVRWDKSDGDKVVLPLTFCEGSDGLCEWRWQSFPEPRPMFNLDQLAARPGAPVLVVEGEKSANAAQSLFPDYVVVTSPGGSNSSGKTDWTPLRGRSVSAWPDNDGPGTKYVEDVVKHCHRVGAAEVDVVEVPTDFPVGWDLADVTPDGWNWICLIRLLANAKPGHRSAGADVRDTESSPDDAQAVADADVDPPRLRADTVGDFLALDIPPRELILTPFLPSQGLGMLYSKRGVGKTHLSLGIAYAVATRGKFLTWSAPSARRTLFIDGEMPAATIQDRLAGIVAASDLEPPAPDYLRVVTPDRQQLGIPDLATEEGQQAVDEILGDAELLILDNLSALCRASKENEGDDWAPIQEWLLRLRSRGVSVLLVHHAGKSGDQRGTSRREDVLDSVISLKHPGDYLASDGARFEVHYMKSRAFTGDEAKPFEARLETRDGEAFWTTKDLEESRLDQVAELLNEGVTQKDIAEQLGIDKSNVSRRAQKARELGLVELDRDKK